MFIDIMSELGANPQQMQWTETFSALQQGVVDGQENPIGAVIIPQRVYEVQKYITTWHYSYDPAFLAVSKKLWDSLGADEQKTMKVAAEKAMKWQKEETREQTAKGIDFLRENGMGVYSPSKVEIAAFREATKQSFEMWSSKVGKDLVSLFQQTIDESKDINTMDKDITQTSSE
jgi:TRAP-type C4-dicarboxylate transport system substrate-binding protein